MVNKKRRKKKLISNKKPSMQKSMESKELLPKRWKEEVAGEINHLSNARIKSMLSLLRILEQSPKKNYFHV